jgi:uncharacterized protein (TIGR02271 family)
MKKNTEKVVGVFLDESYAQSAAQALQAAGYKAHIADESAIKAFKNSGFQDEVVNVYQSRYNEGNSILVVDAESRGEDALGIMLDNGAEYINLSDKGNGKANASQYAQMDTTQRQYGRVNADTGRAQTAEDLRLRLHSEELSATKTAQQAGEVEVRKVVHEREQQVPVNLRHEEVYIERRAVNEAANPDDIRDMQDEVIRVPVYEEQAQLQKQARVTEEVVIGKQAVEEQQTLSGTVRHEHVEVANSGDIQVHGNAGAEEYAQDSR